MALTRGPLPTAVDRLLHLLDPALADDGAVSTAVRAQAEDLAFRR